MHQLQLRGRGARRPQCVAHEIFDGLDVVIDALLDGLDRRRAVVTGIVGELRAVSRRTAGPSGMAGRCRSDSASCSTHRASTRTALADQPAFGQQHCERFDRGTVTTVDRGKCSEAGIHA